MGCRERGQQERSCGPGYTTDARRPPRRDSPSHLDRVLSRFLVQVGVVSRRRWWRRRRRHRDLTRKLRQRRRRRSVISRRRRGRGRHHASRRRSWFLQRRWPSLLARGGLVRQRRIAGWDSGRSTTTTTVRRRGCHHRVPRVLALLSERADRTVRPGPDRWRSLERVIALRGQPVHQPVNTVGCKFDDEEIARR